MKDKYGNDVNEFGQMTKKEFIHRWHEHIKDMGYTNNTVPECTCESCPSATNGECEWAYDLYNTNGDCLATK